MFLSGVHIIYSDHLPIFKQLFGLLLLNLKNFFCAFKIQHACQTSRLETLSPVLEAVLCTLSFEAQKLLTLSSSIFLFVAHAFGITSKKPLPSLRL